MNYFEEQIIVDYLENRLSEEDKLLFEKELSINDKLKKELNGYKESIGMVNLAGRNELRKKIIRLGDNKNLKTNTNNQKTITMNTENKKNNKSIFWAIAAGLALLVVGYTFMGKETAPDPAKIFADNYVKGSKGTSNILKDLATKNIKARGVNPEEDEKMVMYNGEEITAAEFAELEKLRRDTLMMGLKLFDQSKWLESKQVLHNYTTNHKVPVEDYATALYYLAKTSLNTDLYKVAITNFEEFLTIPNTDKKMLMDAEWEHALCLLNVNEKKARESFDVLAKNNDHAYQDEAAAILAYFE